MTDAAARIALVLKDPGVASSAPPSRSSWPSALAEPADLAALYAATDGLELADGTRILPRGEIARATAWLVEDKALDWFGDLLVVGERDALVLVRDLDAGGERAGGGLLEAPTDGLEELRRVALGVVEYRAARLGLPEHAPIAPERAAREAIALRDPDAIEAAVARGF
ncbi:MAG TPA: hypothetical protein VHB21_16660, partial [Minicystis sp.]|nr:hypothetical protein [Minicystis sp.]